MIFWDHNSTATYDGSCFHTIPDKNEKCAFIEYTGPPPGRRLLEDHKFQITMTPCGSFGIQKGPDTTNRCLAFIGINSHLQRVLITGHTTAKILATYDYPDFTDSFVLFRDKEQFTAYRADRRGICYLDVFEFSGGVLNHAVYDEPSIPEWFGSHHPVVI